jgi:predicted Rossmann-fold nucleotide-binding protein
VELSDVVLCVAPREESDWEEGPALRRAQAAKQAQLAAAELAKLGSRVAATGSTSGAKPAAAAAASAAAGSGTSWGWMIADYVLSFLLNRLQFAVRNVHVYFQVRSSQTVRSAHAVRDSTAVSGTTISQHTVHLLLSAAVRFWEEKGV